MDRPDKHRVVIIGGGFAGLWATRSLVNKDSITIYLRQDQITMHQRMKDMDTKDKSEIKLTNCSRVGIDDFYWLAVPIQEIEDEAKTKGSRCFKMRGDTLIKRAGEAVKVILCDCASQIQSTVDAAPQCFLSMQEQKG